MKNFLTTVCLAAVAASALAQGTIKFANTASILVSYECTPGAYSNTPANAFGTFYYAVLSAPIGVLDPSQFVFAGIYATNTGTAGRLQGGSLLGVAMNSTWQPGQTRQFLVAGWSADNGPVFQPSWFAHDTTSHPWGDVAGAPNGLFGLSMVALGQAGPGAGFPDPER